MSFLCLGSLSPLFGKDCGGPVGVTGPSLRPWGRDAEPSPHHVQGGLGRSSAVAAGGEGVPEAGAAGGVRGSAPGQHAAYCGGYVWGLHAGGNWLWVPQHTLC